VMMIMPSVSIGAQYTCDIAEDVTGTVKWFNDRKGYGFITLDDNSNDVFVHYTAIVGTGFRTLEDGEPVMFDVGMGPKGLTACHVVVLD